MNTMKCAKCGHVNPHDAHKCQKCDHHLYVFCPCCGQWELRIDPARYQAWHNEGFRYHHHGIDPNLKAILVLVAAVGLVGLVLSALLPTLPSMSAWWERAKQDAYERGVERSTQPSINEQIERYRSR